MSLSFCEWLEKRNLGFGESWGRMSSLKIVLVNIFIESINAISEMMFLLISMIFLLAPTLSYHTRHSSMLLGSQSVLSWIYLAKLIHVVFGTSMNMTVQMDYQVIVILHLVQGFTSCKYRNAFSMTIKGCTRKCRTHVGQKYLWSRERIWFENSINVFFILLFSLVGKAFPHFLREINIIVSRKGASKSNYTQSNFEDELFLVDIENIRRDMLLTVQVA